MTRTVRLPRQWTLRLLALAIVAFFLMAFVSWSGRKQSVLDSEQRKELWIARREEVALKYEEVRVALLEASGYEPHAAERSVGSPPWTADGHPTLTSSSEAYSQRLLGFIRKAFQQSSMHPRFTHAVSRVAAHVPPTTALFTTRFHSCDRLGESGVQDLFRLWEALLPLPLGPPVENLLPDTEWANPARRGAAWKVVVADDTQMDKQVTNWIGIHPRSGPWSQFWAAIGHGILRTDVYRYLAMLYEGGVYADSDTVPIAHPYLWGLDAESIVHPDLDLINTILMKHIEAADQTHRRIWDRSAIPGDGNATTADGTGAEGDTAVHEQHQESEPTSAASDDSDDTLLPAATSESASDAEAPVVSDTTSPSESHAEKVFAAEAVWHNNASWTSPYPPSSRQHSRRSPVQYRDNFPPDDATSILAPDINLVIAIDFDSSIAFDWRRMTQWSISRLRRSVGSVKTGRKLQFSQYVIAAKPYHPVFVDVLATIWEKVDTGAADKLSITDFTGDGPLTDAVLRYLLVRYGVTAYDLRGLRGAVRVGDVLILPEGALDAPESATLKALAWVQNFFPSLPGSGMAKAVKGQTLWFWGAGWTGWGSGGRRVVYHGSDQMVEVGYDDFE